MVLRSWLEIPRGSHFSLANIPFGIISTKAASNPHPAISIGEDALDLEAFTANNGFAHLSMIQPHSTVFSQPTLNAFAALGQPIHSAVRKYLQSVLLADGPFPDVLRDNATARTASLISRKEVQLHLPFQIGDYTDFYAGLNHAYNAGVLFRGPSNALQPNYKHLPVGYHGRASSVVTSGTPITRPSGQILPDPSAEVKQPVHSPCRRLDFELEIAAFVCKPNAMGEPIPISEAAEHIFGVVLMNDWSARDIQAWEYVPLGPFNGKNFGTTISPWVVLWEALQPFMVAGLHNDTTLLPYLQESRTDNMLDMDLEVDLSTKPGNTTTISRTNSRNLIFSFPQMLAHHSSTGCPFNVGDLLGSGTISGTEPDALGSLLEQNKGGKEHLTLHHGEHRTWLEDGDTVTFRGCCGTDEDALVGFGECVGTIEPAKAIPDHA